MKQVCHKRHNGIEETVLKEMERYGLRSLVVGLSGGADSVALLYSLYKIRSANRRGNEISIRALHCNFHLRGEESDRDERFCRDLCFRLSIPLDVFQCPVSEWKKENRGSDEMACREMRYSHFARVMKESGADAVAIAHNADDNAETFFINLMRAGGSNGLGGMEEFSNRIFRPLLSFSKREIEKYLEEERVSFVTDSTNLGTQYRRNFIRHKVLPVLEEEWPEARRQIVASMEILRRENKIAEWALEKVLPSASDTLKRETVNSFPDTLTLFRHFLKPYGVSSVLIAEIARTAPLPYGGRKWIIGDGVTLWENRDGWQINKRGEGDVKDNTSLILNKEEYELTSDFFSSRVLRAPLSECWTNSGEHLEWRKWEKGDRIRPLGMKGSRLISDILSEAKIPNSLKEDFHVLAIPGSDEVIWIPRLKRSRRLLVDEGSLKVTRYYTDDPEKVK